MRASLRSARLHAGLNQSGLARPVGLARAYHRLMHYLPPAFSTGPWKNFFACYFSGG
ncbi:hypothetical protein [Desulfofundulus thermocisternus]|uniref:hypothetical protein n=1 Tax=Desulfofundulus thermocisternus TaxID=42471 RepID=UPI001A0E5340|nr:hypothetical protein [Desulfofundulus thermocisternus]MBE3585028.1 hypothetical protein [Thermoanaerobacter sp.]MCS5694565.1 hypothetical protein [Desulfofundulus thermocisternus]